MFGKIISNLILILLMVATQNLFLHLPLGFNFVNLSPVVIVFILVIFGPELAIIWAVSAGLIFDIMGFLPAGSNLIGLLLVCGLTYVLLLNVVTDRSLYALWILSAAATVADGLVLNIGKLISGNYFSWAWLIDWRFLFKPLLANLLLTTILFYIFNLVTRRVQPVFLRDKR